MKDASKKLDTAGEDFNKGQSSYNKVEISTSDWKGERRAKSDSKKKDVDSELKKVEQDFDDAKKAIKKDIQDKEEEIKGVEGEISTINAAIDALKSKL